PLYCLRYAISGIRRHKWFNECDRPILQRVYGRISHNVYSSKDSLSAASALPMAQKCAPHFIIGAESSKLKPPIHEQNPCVPGFVSSTFSFGAIFLDSNFGIFGERPQ